MKADMPDYHKQTAASPPKARRSYVALRIVAGMLAVTAGIVMLAGVAIFVVSMAYSNTGAPSVIALLVSAPFALVLYALSELIRLSLHVAEDVERGRAALETMIRRIIAKQQQTPR